uniref:hypothetical protein n=1 Tax=Gemmiger formicilis TaxID=745368 RepID=UPI004028CB8B
MRPYNSSAFHLVFYLLSLISYLLSIKRISPMRYRTLDKNWQFNRVYGRGKSYVHPHCVLYVAKTGWAIPASG